MKNINNPYSECLNYRSLHCVDMECDTETAKKIQKFGRNIDSSILDRFWDLVDVSDKKRLIAAEKLLRALFSKQPQVSVTH